MAADVLEILNKPPAEAPLPPEKMLRLYELMCLTRHLDERALKLQRSGRISFYVSTMGQEAAQVGSAFAMEHEDYIVPAYREPGAALARGVKVSKLIAQYFGSDQDVCFGRQMPVHYCFRTANYLSVSSPIGTQISQAAGLGMAFNIKKEKRACIVYFGDGATSSNDFHSGLTFGGVYKAPVVFFCSNNGWAISCPTDQQCAAASLSDKAVGYGMPGVVVDGNDVLAVYKATRDAAERGKRGEGPTFIEALTRRMGPHSTSDDDSRYRDSKELEDWKAKDPILRFKAYLVERGLLDEAADQAVWARAREGLDKAIAQCQGAKDASPATLFKDVYAKMPWHLEEQWRELREELG